MTKQRKYQFSHEDLVPGETVYVRGKTAFTRIASLIEGAELERRNSRSNSLYKNQKPYVNMSITEPVIEPADPANYTFNEKFHNERIYVNNNGVPSFQRDFTTKILPMVFLDQGEKDDNGNTVLQQINPLEGELAQGQDVTLVLNHYATTTGTGIGLQAVIVHEPEIRYSVSGISGQLAARGLVISGSVTPQRGAEAAPNNTGVVGTTDNGLPAMPTQQQQAPQQPQAPQNYGQQQPQQQPNYNQQQAPQGGYAPQQPQQPNYGQQQAPQQGGPQQPQQPQAPTPPGQSAFDSNDDPWKNYNGGITP